MISNCGLATLFVFLLVHHIRGFPPLGHEEVVLLGSATDLPSPDLVHQAEALEKSGNSAIVASSQEASADVEADASEVAKAAGQQVMVTKSQDAGADPSAVATQAASDSDPSESASTGPDQDSAMEAARSKSVSRAQDIDMEAINSQRRQEQETLSRAAKGIVPNAAAIASERTEPDAVQAMDDNSEIIPSSKGTDSQGFYKLAKMTVPDKGTALLRIHGSLSHCQEACNRATLCTGLEFSKENGGVCILLKKGIRWSNTFEYYDKVTPDSSDPVKATKYDKQLMWGAISERSLDLGGLAVDDVPDRKSVV